MRKTPFAGMNLHTKLILAFVTTIIIMLVVNLYMYNDINRMSKRVDEAYKSNRSLNELSVTLELLNNSMTDYLNTKTTDSMEEYYRQEQEFRNLITNLSDTISSEKSDRMEYIIRNMSENYLILTNQAIDAKRGRNIERYSARFNEAEKLFGYINTYITSLNEKQFQKNASNYELLSKSLQYQEITSTFVLIIVAALNVILVTLVTRTITNPLIELSQIADEVAGGNLDIQMVPASTYDEVGRVSRAFYEMLNSIREYIQRIKTGLELERELKEKELLMKSHLKDAQIKYLQAQINPHFLFNSLNAGAQLAMMEDADKTYRYLQNLADFFRYNVKKNNETVTLDEELELIDNYIYILNVRFSGEIKYEKKLEDEVLSLKIPSMIIQPVVENCVNYGIRGIDWTGKITLSVYSMDDNVCISIKDNGIGMEKEKIECILAGNNCVNEMKNSSNGVGLNNVISRLRLFYGKEDIIDIVSQGEGKGTEVIFSLPKS